MRLEGCDTCSGSGVKAGTEPNVCSACGGAGQVGRPALPSPSGTSERGRVRGRESEGGRLPTRAVRAVGRGSGRGGAAPFG